MSFVPFAMERWQSTYEFRVRHNLSESGVWPLTLHELCELSGVNDDVLRRLSLGYTQTNGSDELRERIATLYAGATAENVLVTTGSAEANFLVCWALARDGGTMAVLAPTYMQTWGLADNFGAKVRPIFLREELGWQPNETELDEAITDAVDLVGMTNPNNPTGYALSDAALTRLAEAATRADAWLLADEVYRGAELDGTTTRSAWGLGDRVVVTSGLSKAYGLPGLRIGWVVGPADFIASLWSRHDYTVIGPSALSDFLAREALAVREQLLSRTRNLLCENITILEEHLARVPELHWRRPEAGAICYVRYDDDTPSLELAERLRNEFSTLIVPGAHFHMESYMRLGYGDAPEHLTAGLTSLTEGLRGIFG